MTELGLLPQWKPLRQRTVLSHHLDQLTPDDIATYIDHRIRVATDDGCHAEFATEVKAGIRAAANGIPRLINILFDNALLVGYVKGETASRGLRGESISGHDLLEAASLS